MSANFTEGKCGRVPQYGYGKLIGLLLAACLLLPVPNIFAQGKDGNGQENRKWNQRRLERLKDYQDATGKVRPDLWKKGIEHFKNTKIAAGIARVSPDAANGKAPAAVAAGTGLTGVQWVQVGPQPAFPIEGLNFQGNGAMSGEVLDIAIDPRGNSDEVIYSVTNDGGVWRSMDGGVTFESKTDNMPSLSMGAIVLDPDNPSIVYAGTGNLYDGNGSTTTLAVKAVGIYRSVDMGETWTVLNPGGIFTGRGIAMMAMPDGDVLLVATQAGLFKSVNGGMSFGTAPLYNDGNPVRAGSIDAVNLDVTDPTIVYASVNGQGIFQSTDSGDTFPTNLFTNANGSPIVDAGAGGFAFIRMAQSLSMPAWIYATVQESGNPDGDADGFLGIYRSTDGGANWTRLAAADPAGADNGGCQCGYDQTIAVDPQNHLRVYFAFQELYLLTGDPPVLAGGGNAISTNFIHWDHHYIGFSPQAHWGGLNPTPMWIGTDGGVHSSSDGGASYNNFHNSTIASNLFHNIDIGRGSAANNEWTVGGTQDTGTLHSCAPAAHCDAPVQASGDSPWEMGTNGDGSGVAIDPTNPLRMYGVRNGGYRYSDDGGKTWINPAGAVPTSAWRYSIDPNDNTRVWAVTGGTFSPTNQIFRSNDGTGTNWSLIQDCRSAMNCSANFPANIREIENTPADSNVLWLGLTDGTVMVSTNATAAAPLFSAPINIPSNPGTSVSEIAINPQNSAEVVVTYRGLCGGACSNAANRMRRIFRTTTGGATWADISGTDGNPEGNLPNLPTHSVVYDIGTAPPSIVISNDAGVMRSGNNGATWERLGLGLPTADSKMLKIDQSVDPPLLRLGTYGRSVWELSEAQGPILAVNADLGFDTVCIGERQTRVVQLFNVGSEDLVISAFFRSSGSTQFRIIGGPPTPVVIPPGGEIDYTIEFSATVAGIHTATFQINSNDQFFPTYVLEASGTVNEQMIALTIADSGSFGEVCLGDLEDLDLTITNVGCGILTVSDITITGADASSFDDPNVNNLPLLIAAGTSTHVPIRFNPTAGDCGDTRMATVNVFSDDSNDASKSVNISGIVPCPDLNVAIANSGSFGNVCLGDQADLDLTLFNQGRCDLTIDSITIDNPNFVLPADTQYPLVLSHDADFTLPVRFQPDPAELCSDDTPREGTITIVSDSPGESPLEIDVSGNVPCPNLVIDPAALTGLYSFPPTVVDSTDVLGCFSDKPVVVRNTGACPLTIDDVSADGVGDPEDYNAIAPTQFPIILPPGEETLVANVRFTPQTDASPTAPSQLLGLLTILSDDPDAPGTAELCGQSSAQSGAQLLVVDVSSGTPVPVEGVDRIDLMSKGKNTPSPVGITLTNAPVSSTTVCGNTVLWHLDAETLPSAGTTGNNPNASYEVTAKEGNLQSKSSFTLDQCQLVVQTLQLTSAGGKGGKGGGKP